LELGVRELQEMELIRGIMEAIQSLAQLLQPLAEVVVLILPAVLA
jgi:hypothetical protein